MMTPQLRALLTAFFFTFCSAIATAGETYQPSDLSAAQVLLRAEKAVGKLEPGAYKEIDTIVGGGLTTVATTHQSGDDYTTIEQSGDFTSAYGRYQGQSWSQDENGVVLLRSGFHARENPDAKALAAPEDPKSAVRMLGISPGPPREYVIDVNPADGIRQRRYYDASTFFLNRVERSKPDYRPIVTTYTDYRRTYGLAQPFIVHSSNGIQQDDYVDTTASFVPAKLQFGDLGIRASRSLVKFPNGDPITIPITFSGQGLMVRVTINGRGLDFILDSGSSSITIDPAIAAQLKLPLFGKTTESMGGNFDVSLSQIPEMSIGALHLKNIVTEVMPFSAYTSSARAVGLIGEDFLASAVVGIDMKKESLTLYPSRAFDPTGMRKLPIDIDDGIPRVHASIEGVEGNFLLDTGASSTFIYPQYVKRLPDAAMSGALFLGRFIGGDVYLRPYSVTNLVFGPITFQRAETFMPMESTVDLFQYDGILGRDVLKHYLIYLDYANRAVYLKPNQ